MTAITLKPWATESSSVCRRSINLAPMRFCSRILPRPGARTVPATWVPAAGSWPWPGTALRRPVPARAMGWTSSPRPSTSSPSPSGKTAWKDRWCRCWPTSPTVPPCPRGRALMWSPAIPPIKSKGGGSCPKRAATRSPGTRPPAPSTMSVGRRPGCCGSAGGAASASAPSACPM